MTFYCDEGVDRQMVERLRADGYDTRYVAELDPGISDEEVLRGANELGAILITMDKDFGELVYRLGRITSGLLLVRLHGHTPAERAEAVSVVVRDHGVELPGAFSVLSPSRLRIRRER